MMALHFAPLVLCASICQRYDSTICTLVILPSSRRFRRSSAVVVKTSNSGGGLMDAMLGFCGGKGLDCAGATGWTTLCENASL